MRRMEFDEEMSAFLLHGSTMPTNTSLHVLKSSNNDGATSVDIKYIMHIVHIILYSITIIFGIPGNIVVIWMTGFKLKPTVTYVWLVNLAIADLIFCVTRVFSLIKEVLYHHWPFGIFLCKFNTFFTYANMFCSVFLLAVISLDRALCVWKPVFTKRRRTVCVAKVVGICVWILAIIFSTPYFIYQDVYPGKNNLSKCSLDMKSKKGDNILENAIYSIRFLCGFLLPFIVIFICYVMAGIRIRHTRFSGKSRPLRILALLVITFFLCWAPYHCLLLVNMVDRKNSVVKIWQPLVKGVAYFNSCLNPILYFCMGVDVRGRVKQSLTTIYRRALVDGIDGQMTQSNERTGDDNDGSKHSVLTGGRSQYAMDVAKV